MLLYWIAGIGIVFQCKHNNKIHSYIQSLNPLKILKLINFFRISKENVLKYQLFMNVIYKIVKICQKCANFERGSLSEKLLRIEKSSSKLYKLLKSYRAESV